MFNRKLRQDYRELKQDYRELKQENAEFKREIEFIKNAIEKWTYMIVALNMENDFQKHAMRKIAVPIELSMGAKIPEYKTPLSAGADLCCVIDNETKSVVLHPNQKWLFNTGIKLQLPPNAEAQMRPRSGISLRCGLVTVLGTIDADYRGELRILLHNCSKREQLITHGDRLAQIVFNGAGGLFQADFRVVEKVENDTERGENGFGHTGINDNEKEL